MAALPIAAGCAMQAPKPAPTVAGTFGGTDRAWIEVNIAMDEQMRPLLDLVPQRAADPAVMALAIQVRAFTDTELPALRLVHDQAGLPTQNPHEGMPMPGMVTAAEVAEAATLRGTEFDALTVKKVKEYLVQGVNLAQSETKYGVEPRTRALAANGLSARNQTLSSVPTPQPAHERTRPSVAPRGGRHPQPQRFARRSAGPLASTKTTRPRPPRCSTVNTAGTGPRWPGIDVDTDTTVERCAEPDGGRSASAQHELGQAEQDRCERAGRGFVLLTSAHTHADKSTRDTVKKAIRTGSPTSTSADVTISAESRVSTNTPPVLLG